LRRGRVYNKGRAHNLKKKRRIPRRPIFFSKNRDKKKKIAEYNLQKEGKCVQKERANNLISRARKGGEIKEEMRSASDARRKTYGQELSFS